MAKKYLRSEAQLIQAFPLMPGQVNIAAAGGAKTAECFCCAVDGTFTVTFNDGTIASLVMVAGDVFSIPDGGTVTATGSATFHYV